MLTTLLTILFWGLFLGYFPAVVGIFNFVVREESLHTRDKLIKRAVYLAIPFFIFLLVTFMFLSGPIHSIGVGISMYLATIPFLIYLLFLLKKIIAPSNWFLLLFAPTAYLLVLCVAHSNTPTFVGNPMGEAFGWIVAFLITIFIFFLFPIFVFLLTMLKLNNVLKGVVLFAISVISGIRGISLSYGIDGFLTDSGGKYMFVYVILVLGMWGGTLLIWRWLRPFSFFWHRNR